MIVEYIMDQSLFTRCLWSTKDSLMLTKLYQKWNHALKNMRHTLSKGIYHSFFKCGFYKNAELGHLFFMFLFFQILKNLSIYLKSNELLRIILANFFTVKIFKSFHKFRSKNPLRKKKIDKNKQFQSQKCVMSLGQ